MIHVLMAGTVNDKHQIYVLKRPKDGPGMCRDEFLAVEKGQTFEGFTWEEIGEWKVGNHAIHSKGSTTPSLTM